MTANIGNIDRVIRIVLGFALIGAPFFTGLALFENITVMVVSVLAGIVMLATSTMRFCPIYRILGIQTCKI